MLCKALQISFLLAGVVSKEADNLMVPVTSVANTTTSILGFWLLRKGTKCSAAYTSEYPLSTVEECDRVAKQRGYGFFSHDASGLKCHFCQSPSGAEPDSAHDFYSRTHYVTSLVSTGEACNPGNSALGACPSDISVFPCNWSMSSLHECAYAAAGTQANHFNWGQGAECFSCKNKLTRVSSGTQNIYKTFGYRVVQESKKCPPSAQNQMTSVASIDDCIEYTIKLGLNVFDYGPDKTCNSCGSRAPAIYTGDDAAYSVSHNLYAIQNPGVF